VAGFFRLPPCARELSPAGSPGRTSSGQAVSGPAAGMAPILHSSSGPPNGGLPARRNAPDHDRDRFGAEPCPRNGHASGSRASGRRISPAPGRPQWLRDTAAPRAGTSPPAPAPATRSRTPSPAGSPPGQRELNPAGPAWSRLRRSLASMTRRSITSPDPSMASSPTPDSTSHPSGTPTLEDHEAPGPGAAEASSPGAGRMIRAVAVAVASTSPAAFRSSPARNAIDPPRCTTRPVPVTGPGAAGRR